MTDNEQRADLAYPWLFGSGHFNHDIVDYGVPAMREAEGDTLEYVTAEEAMARLGVGAEQFRKGYVAILDRVDAATSGTEISSPPWTPPGEDRPDTGAGHKQAQLHLHATNDYAYKFDFETLDNLDKYSVAGNERVYPHKRDRGSFYLEGTLDDWDDVPRSPSDKLMPLGRRYGWLQAKRRVVGAEDMVGCESGNEVWETGFDPGLEPSRVRSSDDVDLYSWDALEVIHMHYKFRENVTRQMNHAGMPRKGGRFAKRT